MHDEFEKIVVVENEVEAELLDSTLSEMNIPHVMRSYHDAAFDGLLQSSMGWGHVEAPPEHHQRIKEIAAELKKSNPENTEN